MRVGGTPVPSEFDRCHNENNSAPRQTLAGKSVGLMLWSGFSAPIAPRDSGFSVVAYNTFALKCNRYVRECQQASDAHRYRIAGHPTESKRYLAPIAKQVSQIPQVGVSSGTQYPSSRGQRCLERQTNHERDRRNAKPKAKIIQLVVGD
jgi:hypothetical protein